MTWGPHDTARGLQDLRAAVLAVLGARPRPAGIPAWMLLSEAAVSGQGPGGRYGDSDRAASSGGAAPPRPRPAPAPEGSEPERSRLIALVDLARGGDAEAFGLLYDHYQGSVYRFIFY